MLRHFFLIGLLIALLVSSVKAAPLELSRGVYLVPGEFIEGRQPDGNSVVFLSADGLIVVDTGRHRTHTRLLLDFAAERKTRISSVINTHWPGSHRGQCARAADLPFGEDLRQPGVICRA